MSATAVRLAELEAKRSKLPLPQRHDLAAGTVEGLTGESLNVGRPDRQPAHSPRLRMLERALAEPAEPANPEPLLRASRLAELLAMNVDDVYRRAKEEHWPAYRWGRLVRFRLSEVLAANRRREIVAGSHPLMGDNPAS